LKPPVDVEAFATGVNSASGTVRAAVGVVWVAEAEEDEGTGVLIPFSLSSVLLEGVPGNPDTAGVDPEDSGMDGKDPLLSELVDVGKGRTLRS
jgi:hypothetical protein